MAEILVPQQLCRRRAQRASLTVFSVRMLIEFAVRQRQCPAVALRRNLHPEIRQNLAESVGNADSVRKYYELKINKNEGRFTSL
jgi:hypothetical protein